ncbi:MAG: aminoacyl-tRNA hydrolase [Deltaproteobacteria bacterium HGW-Deltaproteobacteria-12]|jgi:PTH1 family peptidyl-tRNA hydrolase|nr:MAG: aminoacyl-tRNA hydrolase [Deltaproteobacteria bacterium HGW-Deltaproteobacteria-12]
MHLIVGLGNPGNRYRFTRHNIGFMVLEKLAQEVKIDLKHRSFDAIWGKGKIRGTDTLLALPQTYMNLSGTAVRQLVAFFKADINNLIVIHDDLDLPFGTIRLKAGGGNAGHKGLTSITDNLGSSDFMRVRLGIGKPPDKSRIEGYVLEPFASDEELSLLPEIISTAAEAGSEIILSGIQKAITKYQKNILVKSLKKEDE